jgi:o-succinylbenzoate---CoA ligase
MGQTLKDVLGDRWGDNWLIGPSSEAFWHRLSEYGAVFNAYTESSSSDSPGILIAEPDPLEFLATCLAAWSEGCTVVLANPRWGTREQQQLNILGNPQGESPVLARLGCYPCEVPGGRSSRILIPTGGSSGQIKYAIHTWETLTSSIQGFRDHFGVKQVQAYCVLPLFHVSGLMQVLRVLVSGGCLALQSYGDLKAGARLSLPSGGFLSLVPTQLQELLGLGGELVPWLRSFRAVLLGGAPAGRSLLDTAQALGIPIALTYGMTETASQVATLLPEKFLAGNRSSGKPLPHAQIAILNDQGQPQSLGKSGRVVIQARSLAVGYLPGVEARNGSEGCDRPVVGSAHPDLRDSGHKHQGVNSLADRTRLLTQTGEFGSQSSSEDFGFEPGTSSPWLRANLRDRPLNPPHLDKAESAHPTAMEPFATDDIGYLDGAGYLHIVGRSSSKIITGGENVFPEEIEGLLLATGWVSDACVVGLPCDRWGQRLCALVVIRSAYTL